MQGKDRQQPTASRQDSEKPRAASLDEDFPCLVRSVRGDREGVLPVFRGSHAYILLERGRLYHRGPSENRILAGPLLLLAAPNSRAVFRADGSTQAICLWCSRGLMDRTTSSYNSDTLLRLTADRDTVFAWPLASDAAGRLSEVFGSLFSEYSSAKRGYRDMVQLKLLEALILTERLDATSPRRSGAAGSGGFTVMSADSGGASGSAGCSPPEIADYIREHYSDQFDLKELAGRCGLNPSYFSRLFKERIGTPVFEYINGIRIEKACGLLKRTEMTIIEIAYSVGYNNVSFFNRYFRKLMDMSPREYRSHVQDK